ncbi:hypothetical protein H4R21_006245, partial [Coemansia helicoidea]
AALDIDYKCAFRNTYQLLDYLNSSDESKGKAFCELYSKAGYLAGIGQFSTRWGSALAVVDSYMASPNYKDEFKDIYDALKAAAKDHSVSAEGLDTFCDAWRKAAANGNSFYNSQIAVVRSMHEEATKAYWKQYGIRLPLTRAVLLTTATATEITTKLGDKDYTTDAIIKKTNAKFSGNVGGKSGSSVKAGKFLVDEIAWLRKFLDTADELTDGHLKKAHDVFRYLIKEGYYTLDSDITLTGYKGQQATLTCGKPTDPVSKSS